MTSTPVKPTRGKWSKGVKLVISTIYLLTPLAIAGYRAYHGQRIGPMLILILLLLMFASAYVIFGEKTVDKATEKAKEITGGEDNDDDEGKK